MNATPTPLRAERPTGGEGFHYTPLLTLALQALEDRVLFWTVTGVGGWIWCYTLLHPDLLRIGAATLYSLTVIWPFLYLKRRG